MASLVLEGKETGRVLFLVVRAWMTSRMSPAQIARIWSVVLSEVCPVSSGAVKMVVLSGYVTIRVL